MVAAAEASGKLLMVSQSRRYFRAVAAFERQLAELGPVGSLSCEFFKSPRFGGFRERMAEPLLVDMAIHQFDLARKLIGAEPVSVFCDSYNPAWSWFDGNAAADAVFSFDGGARFAFTGSWCAPGQETSWNGRWRASSANGTAIWDGDSAPTAELRLRRGCASRPRHRTRRNRRLAGGVRPGPPHLHHPSNRGPHQRHQRRHGRSRRPLLKHRRPGPTHRHPQLQPTPTPSATTPPGPVQDVLRSWPSVQKVVGL